ncbi:MAG TPA: hypothetical protein VI912_00180 [Candidatus Bilamarchaeaceae archaeon]|nr:hypothetical protein [Candidatus Bilamarchaeaceae archaeon]
MANAHLDDIADEIHGPANKNIEVAKPVETPKPAPQPAQEKSKSSFPIIPIVVILLILGALYYGYTQGFFDSFFEKKDEKPTEPKENKTTTIKNNTPIKTVENDGPPPLPDEFFGD